MGREMSSEVRGCCGMDGSSFIVTVAWSFVALVANAPVGDNFLVASWSEETEDSETLAAGPDVMSFWNDGGGTDCNSATAAARFVGHSEFLMWIGE
jgi:hypothetical protein